MAHLCAVTHRLRNTDIMPHLKNNKKTCSFLYYILTFNCNGKCDTATNILDTVAPNDRSINFKYGHYCHWHLMLSTVPPPSSPLIYIFFNLLYMSPNIKKNF